MAVPLIRSTRSQTRASGLCLFAGDVRLWWGASCNGNISDPLLHAAATNSMTSHLSKIINDICRNINSPLGAGKINIKTEVYLHIWKLRSQPEIQFENFLRIDGLDANLTPPLSRIGTPVVA